MKTEDGIFGKSFNEKGMPCPFRGKGGILFYSKYMDKKVL